MRTTISGNTKPTGTKNHPLSQLFDFLFIGAPLGAIIRKGGLGMPVVVSVLIFVIYYIIDSGATRVAKAVK